MTTTILKHTKSAQAHIAVHRQEARLMTANEAGQWRTDAEWLLILADAERDDYPAHVTENSRLNARAIIAAIDAELTWRKRKGIHHPGENLQWDRSFLDSLKARVRLESIVSQTVDLRRRGSRLVGLCPFHADKRPSLVIYPDDGGWHCFGCGAHGDLFSWAMNVNRMTFKEAVYLIAAYAGVDVPAIQRPGQQTGVYIPTTPPAAGRPRKRRRPMIALEGGEVVARG